jgi:YD repeat-containing protein
MAAAAHLAVLAALGQTSSSGLSTRHEAYGVQPAWRRATSKGQLGLEIERTLPGGVRATWQRDNVGRPLKHEIWSGKTMIAAKAYTWEPNDRLQMIVDALNGPLEYRHDKLGNLTAAIHADGKVDLRMPDAVGNLFRTADKSDRKYGPAGQLLESTGPQGVTKYEYDPEGSLVKKVLPDGGEWQYEWNGAGMLAKVVRPDSEVVEFGYDALGRRVWKKHGAKTTRWMWDGNVPVHEWVESVPSLEDPAPEQATEGDDDGSLAARKFMLTKRFPRGPHAKRSVPPMPPSLGSSSRRAWRRWPS